MSRTSITLIVIALVPLGLTAQTRQRGAATVEQEVVRAERQYLDARLANDTVALGGLLAAEFTGIGSNGRMGDRSSALRAPTNVTPGGRQPIEAMDLDSVHVHVYGTAAVMTGLRTLHLTGSPSMAALRFMHVFVRRQGDGNSPHPRSPRSRSPSQLQSRTNWARIRAAMETHLRYEPMKTSKSRIKRMRGLTRPQYRLRVDEFRMFYDLRGQEVQVLSIVSKSEAVEWRISKGGAEP